MPIIHYLNVKNGDCSLIQHASGRVTVIDVCNAKVESAESIRSRALMAALFGKSNQKAHPVNPINYLDEHSIESVFRFILTHPDMDHMDGIKAFFGKFAPLNFWDTENRDEKEFEEGSPYNQEDWEFYRDNLRDARPETSPKRLTLHSGSIGQYWNQHEVGASGGDGLHILAPTPALVEEANQSGDYNDASYVILYRSAGGGKTIFAGDSHDGSWEHILRTHKKDVTDVDLLIAPHHGRKSERSWDFLDVLRPKLTFFGNAPSEHLAYDAWRSRNLSYVTNNQGGCLLVDAGAYPMKLYVTSEEFAKTVNPSTTYSTRLRAYYCGEI